MATSSMARAATLPVEAIAKLKHDHRVVDALFREFSSAAEHEQARVAVQVCQWLTAPVTTGQRNSSLNTEALDIGDAKDFIDTVEVGSGSANQRVTEGAGMRSDKEVLRSTVRTLSDYLRRSLQAPGGVSSCR